MVRTAKVPETKEAPPTLDEVEESNAHQKSRESKRNENLTKDLMYGNKAYKRTVQDTVEEKERRYARLHTFGGETQVSIMWDINAETIRDQVVMIQVGDKKSYISAIELQKYLRWV